MPYLAQKSSMRERAGEGKKKKKKKTGKEGKLHKKSLDCFSSTQVLPLDENALYN